MSEDYYDVVFLNEETTILYGRTADGRNFYRVATEEETDRLCSLERKYACEREALLRDMADEAESA